LIRGEADPVDVVPSPWWSLTERDATRPPAEPVARQRDRTEAEAEAEADAEADADAEATGTGTGAGTAPTMG
jgi:hypothetical protein